MREHLKRHTFTLWLLGAVMLAIVFPGPGSKGGIFISEWTTDLGVLIIFLLQGISLPTSDLTTGYKPKRLHVFVLSWNFLLFPIVVGILMIPISLVLPSELRLGFWLLSILPTTVSSAVVFSAVSGGNTSNAIFATVFSNLVSILLVPTVAVAYLAFEVDANVPLVPLFTKLFLLIVLPLLVGQLIRKFGMVLSEKISKRTKGWVNWIIVFIVHCAFAQSVQSGFLEELGLLSIAFVISITVIVLLVVSRLVWWSSAWFKPTRGQRIAAFFCASQKSLATGLPLTASILAAAPEVVDSAAMLIPLMCYHPAQLVLAVFVSGRWSSP